MTGPGAMPVACGGDVRRPYARGVAARPGFSLVELMIATVILGIGLVMVATIFPVAVDQTREAVQMSIAQSVARSAEETLRLRMRTVTGTGTMDVGTSHLPGDRPHETSDKTSQDPTPGWAKDLPPEPVSPSNYDVNPSEQYGYQPPTACGAPLTPSVSSNPRSFRIIRLANMRRTPEDDNDCGYFFPGGADEGALYDPWTECMLEGVPAVLSQFACGLGPKVWPDWNIWAMPYWNPSRTPPRIDVLDRVFPVVRPRMPTDPLNNIDANGNPRYADLREAAERRYCWAALGRPGEGSAGPDGTPFHIRILVMYRGELTARFAAQDPQDGQFDRHWRPQPWKEDRDTIFPQPWLVKFDDGDNDTTTRYHTNYTAESVSTAPQNFRARTLPPGTIICDRNVGDLLPVGATFVDFELGGVHVVLQNNPDPGSLTTLRRLTVTPDPDLNSPNPLIDGMRYHYPDFPDYAWVVPPPIVRTGSGPTDYYFEGKCPVLAVFESHIDREAE